MKATRLDIVFDHDMSSEDEEGWISDKIMSLFGPGTVIDWRDDRTVEITVFEYDLVISTPRPWILEEYK